MPLGQTAVDRAEVQGRLPRLARDHRHRSLPGREPGSRWRSRRLSSAPMWRIAQSPRNGIEPWAIRPSVSISAHQTPRWPRQIRSAPSGSGMITWSMRGARTSPARPARRPRHGRPILVDRARQLERARERTPPASRMLSRDHRGREAALHVAGAAAVEAAVTDRAGERIDAPALAGLDHVEVAVEVDAGTGVAALISGDQVDLRIALAVAERALGAQVADLEAAWPGDCRACARRRDRRRPAG